MREFLNRPGDKWAFIRSKEVENNKIAIFIHGFYGDYLDTWGKLPELLAKNADQHVGFKDWDFLFIGYKTGNLRTYLDITSLIATQWRNARNGDSPFGRKYEKFSLFGHSLGTLGIRQLLCSYATQPDRNINDLHSVILFGTPIFGSSLAQIAFWSSIADALKEGNQQLRMLKTWVESSFHHINWPKIKVVLGMDDKVVGNRYRELVEWDGDITPVDVLQMDHSTLVKPQNWENSTLINYLENALR